MSLEETLMLWMISLLIGLFLGTFFGGYLQQNYSNEDICRQLYTKDTNKYFDCTQKDYHRTLKLIKDITND